MVPPGVPLATSREDQFADLVFAAVDRLAALLDDQWLDVEVSVQNLPPASGPASVVDLTQAHAEIPLGAAQRGAPSAIVLFRRPIELRCVERAELLALIRDVVAQQVATLLDRDPEDLDPDYGLS